MEERGSTEKNLLRRPNDSNTDMLIQSPVFGSENKADHELTLAEPVKLLQNPQPPQPPRKQKQKLEGQN
jgi:hypothetical protein